MVSIVSAFSWSAQLSRARKDSSAKLFAVVPAKPRH
jgi:hypothetical protein